MFVDDEAVDEARQACGGALSIENPRPEDCIRTLISCLSAERKNWREEYEKREALERGRVHLQGENERIKAAYAQLGKQAAANDVDAVKKLQAEVERLSRELAQARAAGPRPADPDYASAPDATAAAVADLKEAFIRAGQYDAPKLQRDLDAANITIFHLADALRHVASNLEP